MRLTSYTNYALRTLMYAALAHPRLVRVQDVADAYGISRTHLVKCVHHLGMWGYLINQRGRNGGFRLARPPEEISVAEIVRRTEEGFGSPTCGNTETSVQRLVDAVQRAQAAFLTVLERYTIADMTDNADVLRPILGFDVDHAA
ncbi:Rrf2 family transcriptional regulator [Pinisolibacter sp.]|uniref:Rrf2 family transcriptional regulator n=1 Tax=Pinisolibacter sp. TaxID=2172024 RepID=UPI002FDD2C65